MQDQEQSTRAAPARPPAGRERRAAESEHPVLELQHQAGNAAVAQMLAVQRHSLNPEEEAGS